MFEKTRNQINVNLHLAGELAGKVETPFTELPECYFDKCYWIKSAGLTGQTRQIVHCHLGL